MGCLLLSVILLLVGGLGALVCRRSAALSSWIAVAGVVAASVLQLVVAVGVLFSGNTLEFRHAWSVPGGSFFVQLDCLSAFFLIPIAILSALGGVYGVEYMRSSAGKRALGASWFFFNTLVASMVMVVLARNAILFLMAWELMALSSFFLVTFEDEEESVREAGWTYLVATHLGAAFLFAMFALFGKQAGSLDFDGFGAMAQAAPVIASIVFVLATIGFGSKAGFVPFHIWLPEAHPAAPSHVSAVMSGVMIKMGIYGIVRVLLYMGTPLMWWGWLLIGIGLISAVPGVLFALAQHDLKRLLAYSSVENIGIITLGIGLGVLGMSTGSTTLMVFGFSAGLLHVLNHALFKGLLFLGAGSVLHATHTRDIDRLGGLLKQMPLSGVTFLVGAVAICGLPPLNGFVSEFLLLIGSFQSLRGSTSILGSAIAVILGLGLIGGLAAACFTKAFGIVFLGEPRSTHAEHAHENGILMWLPMALLATACLGIGLAAPLVLRFMQILLAQVTGLAAEQINPVIQDASHLLLWTACSSFGFLVLVGALAILRRSLLAGRSVDTAGTWDCGYAAPTARMQYTASSYAQPLTDLFGALLRTKREFKTSTGRVSAHPLGESAEDSGLPMSQSAGWQPAPPTGWQSAPPTGWQSAPPTGWQSAPLLFPASVSLTTTTPDVCRESFYHPLFSAVSALLARLRWLQHGKLRLYVLYIALTLMVLLIWKLA